MHELSIALSIVEGAEEEAIRQGGGRVCAVYLKLGALAGVVKEALLFAYDVACEGTPLEGSRLIIEDIPIRILCPACREESMPVSPQRLACALCGASASKVLQGDELQLSALELET